ncbi:MAG: YunC family protein [Candidatus Bathyarchaeales archaeon]
MISTEQLIIDDKAAIGLKVDLPDSPPLLLIIGKTGFVMCGFLNIEVAEKLNVVAATVSGVRTFEDILKAEIKAATSKAKVRGIKVGMKGEEAIRLLV